MLIEIFEILEVRANTRFFISGQFDRKFAILKSSFFERVLAKIQCQEYYYVT